MRLALPLRRAFCALAVFSFTPLAFAQDVPAEPDPATVTDAVVLSELQERFDTAEVLAFDAREPLAALEMDGLQAVHQTASGHTLYASLFGGDVADWVVTDARGTLGGVQPVDTASGACWACASGDGSIVCWQVTCSSDEPAEEMPVPEEMPDPDQTPAPDPEDDGR